MTTTIAKIDHHGRPCRIVTRESGRWWTAEVHSGSVILRCTRVHGTEAGARDEAEAWLAKYLETGSWNAATEATR